MASRGRQPPENAVSDRKHSPGADAPGSPCYTSLLTRQSLDFFNPQRPVEKAKFVQAAIEVRRIPKFVVGLPVADFDQIAAQGARIGGDCPSCLGQLDLFGPRYQNAILK